MSEKQERAIEAALSAHERCKSRNGGKHGMWMEAAIAAYQRVMREPAEGDLRVRVCVAVNSTGGAMWVGGNGLDDEGNRDCSASAGLDRPVQIRWIEATVPGWQPPAEETVEGEVVG